MENPETSSTPTREETLKSINQSGNALASGYGTYRDYTNLWGALQVCIAKAKKNPELGFAEDLATCQEHLNDILTRQKGTFKTIERDWISPFTTVAEGTAIYGLMMLLTNQFTGTPKLTGVKLNVDISKRHAGSAYGCY